MADSTTTHYAFVQPQVGASLNTWGTKLNNDLASIDSLLWSISAGINQGVNTQSNAGTITLTNPLVTVQLITFTAGSQKLVFPAMNAATSAQVGANIFVINNGSNAFQIVAQDGSTNILTSLAAGSLAIITVNSNATANGTFNVTSVGNLLSQNNLSDVGSASTSRTNLGLGASAVENLGASIVDDGSGNLTIKSNANLPGSPTTTTQLGTDNSTKIATTAQVLAAMTSNPLAFLEAANNLADLGSINSALGVLGFAGSAITNGYIKIPNAADHTKPIIIQWATFTSSGSGFSNWTFPIAFPNSCLQVSGTLQASTATCWVVEWNPAGTTTAHASVAVAAPDNSYHASGCTMIAIGF